MHRGDASGLFGAKTRFVGLLLALTVVCAGVAWHLLGMPVQSHASTGRGLTTGTVSDLCNNLPPGTLAYVAEIAPGHNIAQLQAAGYETTPALAGSPLGAGSAANGPAPRSKAVVVREAHEHGPLNVDRLRQTGVVSDASPLLVRSEKPEFKSCNYRLTDNPAAQDLLHTATAAFLGSGLVTRAQVDASSTIFMISDNPFDAQQEYVTAVLEKPAPHTGFSGTFPAVSDYETPVSALVDITTDSVVSVGYAGWLLGQ